MVLYGSALIGACLLAGNLLGILLGQLTGLGTNIGGVGFASLFLLIVNAVRPLDKMKEKTVAGIRFWQGMFLSIVVSMSASQDIIHALDGGLVAVFAGVLPVMLGFLLVPVFCGRKKASASAADSELRHD